MCTPRSNALAERSAHASQTCQSTLHRRNSAFGTAQAGALAAVLGQATLHCRSTVPGDT